MEKLPTNPGEKDPGDWSPDPDMVHLAPEMAMGHARYVCSQLRLDAQQSETP